MKNDYFTTGEFAKICSVSKQTLIYYDRVGIFSPDITGSNGYRYYSYTQIETFTVIAMLRDLGVHIREISHGLPFSRGSDTADGSQINGNRKEDTDSAADQAVYR